MNLLVPILFNYRIRRMIDVNSSFESKSEPTGYFTLSTESFAELEVKKSRFLAIAKPITSHSDFKCFLEQTRSDHPAASHACYAYVVGPPESGEYRYSDDGEPSGCAGKPILNVIQHGAFGGLLIVVLRYYGGTKLGKGGLARAYAGAASATIRDGEKLLIRPMVHAQILCDYASENKIRRELQKFNVRALQTRYEEDLILSFSVVAGEIDQLDKAVINVTGGSSRLIRSRN